MKYDAIEELIEYVALYIRKSRGDLETDLIKHKTIMTDIVNSKGWKYVIYEEIGSGDTIESRPKMKQLLHELDEGLYDAMMIMDFDRLGRGDEEDQGIIKKNLLRNEIFIIECNPYRILNLEDESDLQSVDFKGFLARQEYKMINKRLQRGKKIGAKLGYWTNGLAPFPYDYDSSRKGLVINQENHKTYQRMLDMLFSGQSLKSIANYLNDINYPTPRSKYAKQQNSKWHGNTVANILKSEVHLGKIISNKSKYNKLRKERKELDKSNWVIIENCHDKCKTEEEHEKILTIIYSNQKDKITEKEKINALTGMVKCYNCEQTLPIQRRKNGKYSVRKCPSCGSKGGDCEFIFDLLNDTITKFLIDIDKIAEDLMNNSNIQSIQQEIDAINITIKQKEEEIKRVELAFNAGAYGLDQLIEYTSPAKKELEILTIKVNNLQKEFSKSEKLNTVEIKKNLNKRIKMLKNSKSDKDKNTIYKQIFESIYWIRNDNELDVYIELKSRS